MYKDIVLCLSPHGESGLKSILILLIFVYILSLPTRGEWVEIPRVCSVDIAVDMSLPTRGEWVEIS